MSDKLLAPVLVSVYDRLAHLQGCIASLKKCDLSAQTDLFIVSDGPKTVSEHTKIEEIRQYCRQIKGFKNVSVIERPDNFGMERSIVKATKSILKKFEKIILLEDDLEVSKGFLTHMNNQLNRYQFHKNVFSVNSYMHPITINSENLESDIMIPIFCPWGYGIWKDRFDTIDWESKQFSKLKENKPMFRFLYRFGPTILHSLHRDEFTNKNFPDVRITAQVLFKNLTCVYPGRSLIKLTGLDGSGQNMGKENRIIETTDFYYSNNEQVFDKNLIQRFASFGDTKLRRILLQIYYIRHILTS